MRTAADEHSLSLLVNLRDALFNLRIMLDHDDEARKATDAAVHSLNLFLWKRDEDGERGTVPAANFR